MTAPTLTAFAAPGSKGAMTLGARPVLGRPGDGPYRAKD